MDNIRVGIIERWLRNKGNEKTKGEPIDFHKWSVCSHSYNKV